MTIMEESAIMLSVVRKNKLRKLAGWHALVTAHGGHIKVFSQEKLIEP